MTTTTTTMRLQAPTKERLLAFKKHYNLKSCEEAVELMLRYFDEAGEDPTNPQFTAKAQLAGLEKRLNQVIAFIRQFEKENLRPVLHEITKVNRQVVQIIPPDNERLFTRTDLQKAVMALFETLNGSK